MPLLCKIAAGELADLAIYGGDWPTPDGTGIRDYLHVQDLAEGHVAAMRYLAKAHGAITLNLGAGHGHSVMEVVAAFEKACGRRLTKVDGAAAAGRRRGVLRRSESRREAPQVARDARPRLDLHGRMALAEERRALLNVARLLADAASRWPERTALVDLDAAGGRREFTFEALNVTVARIAAALRARGLNRGDRVAMLMTNSWEYVAAFLAITRAGCIAVPLNTRLLAKEHAHMVSDSGARLLLAHADLLTDRESLAQIPELGCVCTDAFDTLLAEDVGERRACRTRDGRRVDLLHERDHRAAEGRDALAWIMEAGGATTRRRYLRYGDREVTIHCCAAHARVGLPHAPDARSRRRDAHVREVRPGANACDLRA